MMTSSFTIINQVRYTFTTTEDEILDLFNVYKIYFYTELTVLRKNIIPAELNN